MCEKISGYKTFAHIFVCHSTRLSEAGFILSMAFRSSSAPLSAKRVTTLSIIQARNKHKWLSAAKTPLLTRVRVARDIGLGGFSRPASISLSNAPPPTFLVHLDRATPIVIDAGQALATLGEDDRKWPSRMLQSLWRYWLKR